jgi:hypothetical protein
MSIRDLFNKKPASFETALSGAAKIESVDYALNRIEEKESFVPFLDFASASNFAKFGSAELYYEYSIKRVYDNYPYDGSKNEKTLFRASSSYLDKWLYDNKYPKSTGYVNFSNGGWGSLNGSLVNEYGLPTDIEYIYARGGLHTASAGMIGKPLHKTFSDSVIYDSATDRTKTFKLNVPKGFTVEFWLKKDSFDLAKTKKEVILDLWNGENSSSADYGRFTLELSGTLHAELGTNTFRVTLQSGSNGVFDGFIGTTAVTTGSLSSWHHYALSFVSGVAGIDSRIYVDGDLNENKTLGSSGLNEIGGLINGYLGALQTSPSSSNGAQTQNQLKYYGKLDASIDEFRFWNTRRSSEQIYDNWYRDVGGGTNTDDANLNLGLYYKFNEGVIGDAEYDSVVLDYSGRIANGTWTGYASGARNTGSAFVSSSFSITEPGDPIIRSIHPDVILLEAEMKASGSDWDITNSSMLYTNTVPDWIKEEDENAGDNNVKFVYQIMSSYFDTLYAQIHGIDKLQDKVYPVEGGKAIPFSKRLLESKGVLVNDILLNSDLLEKIDGVDDNKNKFEKDLSEIKNLIYTNLYNNIDSILKSKGTEKSIRNSLRCFGIDDELVKLNVYTDNGTQYFKDKYRHTSLQKKYVNFNLTSHFNASIFQTSSLNNTFTYLTGSDSSKEINSAFTAEISLLTPKKPNVFDESFFTTPFTQSSVFGVHEATHHTSDYTWDATDVANLQVYIVRDQANSSKAKFQIRNTDGTINLTSSYYSDLYNNENWNLAVRVKPSRYPYQGNVVEHGDPTFQLEFYGVTHAFGTVNNEFLVTTSLDNATGVAFLTKSKRFYIGAHKTNFTGSVLQQTDIKVGSFRLYQDFLSDNVIRQHNIDPLSFGQDKTIGSTTMFATDMLNTHVPSSELVSINWDFETVTTSDGTGNFIVEDFSSGSTTSKFGWIDNASRLENRGYGHGFPVSSTSVVKNEIIFAGRKQLPEIAYSSDKVIIEDEQHKYFVTDDDVSDNFYSLEKSMNQVVSDEMLRMLSSIVEFNNLIGKGTDRYRTQYKNLNFLRSLFYDKVEEDPDFDKFTRYYKWIDSSVSMFVSQLFPISSRHSEQIADVVESHILERSKYQNKFPLVTSYTATENTIKGSSELRYNWKTGHAPVGGEANTNCTWQKLRKERDDITERERIRQVITSDTTGSHINLATSEGVSYQGSAFALRNLSRPYKISSELKPSIHGGINYAPNKDRDFVYHATHRHGKKGNYGQPVNVLAVGLGTGLGIRHQQNCDDVVDPNKKEKVHLKVVVARYADNKYAPAAISDNEEYAYLTDESRLPINVISSSVPAGYNSMVSGGYKSDVIFTNIHSDTIDLTNEIPMQSPFTERWVGGHQHRHVNVNRYNISLRDDDTGGAPPNNIDNKYTREEAWRIFLFDKYDGDGVFGFVGADYGGPYPDPARKVAQLYREERAKRPVNVKNIQYSTASYSLGNYKQNYEIISAGGKLQNNMYLTKNPEQSNYLPTSIGSILPETTHPMSLIGQAPFVSGNVFGTHHNNRQPDIESLTLLEPVVGFYSSGSFTVRGKDFVTDGNYIEIDEAGSVYDKHRFVIAGGVNNATTSSFGTGSSDFEFWGNITGAIQQALTGAYSTTYTSSSAVYGAAVWMTGATGGADYLSASVNNVSASTFSFSSWIYYSGSNSGDDYLIYNTSNNGNGTAFNVHVDSAGLRCRLNFNQIGGTSKSNDFQWRYADFVADYADRWVHMTITYNSASAVDGMIVYFDAVSASWTGVGNPSTISYNAQVNSIDGIHFLQNPTLAATNWQGGIDETMWWNRELTAGEVTRVYNCAVGHTASSTLPQVADMAFWYGMGDGATDDIANGEILYNSLDASINRLTSINPGADLGFDAGTAMTASSAIISLTATVAQSPDWNAVLTRTAGCSFIASSNIVGGVVPVTGDVRTARDVVNTIVTSSVTNTVISSRFSAPGGIEIQSPAYLDVYSREYSVHNALPFRNLTVRGNSSGEAGTIRLNDHLGNRDGLRTHLSRHSGRFGRDSVYGDIVATSFPKSDSHVLVDNETILWFNLIGSQNGTGQSTHSAWVKVNNLDASHYIFDYGDDKFSAYVNTSGRVVINTEGWTITDRSYFTSTTPITAGQFHHVAIVFNTASSPQPTFYVDGVATGTSKIGTDAAGLFQPTDGLTIGAKNKGASNSIDGSIDEFAVWGTEFSSIQIKNIYEAGRGSALNTIGVNPYNNLELWYSMGDEDDSVYQLYDKSGNGRHSFRAKNINFEVSDDASPSLIKQHRNRSIRPTDQGSLLVPVLKNSYDNGFVTSLIPRTEYQYSWIKDSLGSNYSVIQGKQRVYGYTPADGILSSSVSIDGESGFVPAINFPTLSDISGE